MSENNISNLDSSNPESEEIKIRRIELKKLSENQSDMETVLFLIMNINNSSVVKTAEGNEYNMRDYYLGLANGLLESNKLKNDSAVKLLKAKVKEYKK